jgi:hypothetical protein
MMHSPSIYEDSLIHLQGEQYKIDDSYQVESGKIVSRSKKTGKVQWTTSDLKAYSIRPTQNYVLAHTRGDAIRAIDPNSGNIQWKLTVPSNVEDFSVGPNHAYIGLRNSLRAIFPTSGKEAWSRSDLKPYDIAYYGGLVFIGTQNAEFHALDAQTGETVWNDSLPQGNGFLRVGDGTVYTFAASWMGSYIGQQGIALNRLQAAQTTDELGSITAPVANLLGRGRALERANTTIENNQYQAAKKAITTAERREAIANAAMILLTGSAAYGGGRVSTNEYRRRSLRQGIDEIQSLYQFPIRVFKWVSEIGLLASLFITIS